MKREFMAGLIWLVPSFGTGVVYDDNVFHRPAAEADLSVRFSPRLDAFHRTERLAVSGGLQLDAERFARHHELTTAHAGEAATFDLTYAASRRLSLTGAAAFTETQTPADLNELTALTPGRARARRLMLHPSATYDLGPRASATVGYLVTADTLSGGVSATTRTASASLDRHISAREDVRLEYLEQHYLFGASQASASRAFTAAWTREVDRGTTLTLAAGPRVTAGVLAADLTASARHALRTGSISVSYQQTQTTLIGLAGIAQMRSVTAGAEHHVGRNITLRETSAILNTRQAGLPTMAYRLSGGCAWRLSPGVSFEADYDSELQHGNLYAAQSAQVIRRDAVTMKVVVAEAPAGKSDR